mgnify:CR=1 FL=1|tara:strand:+ start:2605 stop:2955 length:351 start_codon:yes stop_codon:yes gene_type:complete
MRHLRNNNRRLRRLLSRKGKNINYLNEYKYIVGTIHNLNLRCLNNNQDVYEINLIAKDFIKRMLSNYIYFDKWTIDIDGLVNELFTISDRYMSLKNNQVKYIPKSSLIINNINKGI